tara:strand:- start:11 stop:700 length:690 start_codon:yes stop_codon:yes gene_type:complete
MSLKKKIFCALDFSELDQTIQFTDKIKDHIGGIKIGLEFFCKNGPAGVEKMKEFELPIFLDLKLHDIPNTVVNAFRNLESLSPDYLTVHLNGGQRMINELIKYKKKTKIIGVSMLTSLDQKDLKESGIMCDENSYVEKLVKIGVSSGIDGVVSSPREVKLLRKKFENLILVTPGIRLPNENKNDQKRTETPAKAIKDGSSMLIIGRTITKSSDPILSIEKIIQNIENEI